MTKNKAPAAAFRLVDFHQGNSFYWGGPSEVALLEPEFTLSDSTGLEPLVPRSAEPLVFAPVVLDKGLAPGVPALGGFFRCLCGLRRNGR
jgi:hypothetical protein